MYRTNAEAVIITCLLRYGYAYMVKCVIDIEGGRGEGGQAECHSELLVTTYWCTKRNVSDINYTFIICVYYL